MPEFSGGFTLNFPAVPNAPDFCGFQGGKNAIPRTGIFSSLYGCKKTLQGRGKKFPPQKCVFPPLEGQKSISWGWKTFPAWRNVKYQYRKGKKCSSPNRGLFPFPELQFSRGELHFKYLLLQCNVCKQFYQVPHILTPAPHFNPWNIF